MKTLALALAVLQSSPPAAAPGSEGLLLVLNKSDATLAVIDPESGATVRTLAAGVEPHQVAVSPDGRTAIVSDYGQTQGGGLLTVIDLCGGAEPRSIELGDLRRPHGVVFEAPDRVLVTCEANRILARVDVAEGKVLATFKTDAYVSHMVALAAGSRRAFVANTGSASVTVLDLDQGTIVKKIPTGVGCEAIAATPDGREVWTGNRNADTLSVIDAAKLEVVATLPCPKFPLRLAFTPDGKHALVSCAHSGDVAVFDVAARKELRRIAMGESAGAGTEGGEGSALAGEIDGPVPIGLLVRPDGKRAFVANSNAGCVSVLDLEQWTVCGRITAGRHPDGLAWQAPSAPVR